MKAMLKRAYKALPMKRELFTALRHLPVPERAYRHLHFEGPFSIPLPGGGAFQMEHSGLRIENEFFWAGYGNRWERTSLRVWNRLARQTDCILDIGANTGSYALAAKAANPSARVEAFEPVKRIFDKLKNNVALNGNGVQPNFLALSDTNGTATLYDDGGDHTYSASLDSTMQGSAGKAAQTEVNVQTLDHWIAKTNLPPPGLIKIDAERHEPRVLAGAKHTINTHKPAIIVEILDEDIAEAVAKCLSEYVFFEITEGVGLVRMTDLSNVSARNFLALHREDPRSRLIGSSLMESELETAKFTT